MRSKPVRVTAAAVTGSALLIAAWSVAAHSTTEEPHPTAMIQSDGLVMQAAASLGLFAYPPEVVKVDVAPAPGYLNPLRNVSNLVPERIDQGVDFSGSGPVYALGDAIITNASGDYPGWPGGGWITYELTEGPAAGLMVYVAEDITPAVQVGERVSSSTVIGDMFEGFDGIETGWAQPTGVSAESQLTVAGGIGGAGPFPTMVGHDFDELLQSLGVTAAPNSTEPAYGLLPANYPTNWG